MTKQHKATPEQWSNHEKAAGIDGYSSCILELRARVESLEACDKEDANCWSAVRASMHALRARVEASETGANCPYVRSSDEGTSYCALAESGAASPSAAADRILALQDQIRDGAMTLADALKEIGAAPIRSGPESPLVERVAPTDEELLAMRSWSSHGPTFDSDLVDFGRRCYNLARWGTPNPITEGFK
jgi:hypothetical protein